MIHELLIKQSLYSTYSAINKNGEGGIRTHEGVTPTRFRVVRDQPDSATSPHALRRSHTLKADEPGTCSMLQKPTASMDAAALRCSRPAADSNCLGGADVLPIPATAGEPLAADASAPLEAQAAPGDRGQWHQQNNVEAATIRPLSREFPLSRAGNQGPPVPPARPRPPCGPGCGFGQWWRCAPSRKSHHGPPAG